MPSVIAYCILLYGKPYLATALEAIAPQVDKIVILYTATPSQGFSTAMTCPDTEDELYAIAEPYMPHLEWVRGSWPNEGEHNDAINQYAEGFDWIVRFDSDEVYQPGTVKAWIEQASQTAYHDYRAPFLHFWQAFDRVCRDGQNPQRLIRNTGGEGFGYLDQGENERYRVLHFGYAQPTIYLEYKMQVSGHKSEFRQDWLAKKWLAHAQTDVHPVVFDFWNVEPYDKTKLPDVLKKHPYYNLDCIV